MELVLSFKTHESAEIPGNLETLKLETCLHKNGEPALQVPQLHDVCPGSSCLPSHKLASTLAPRFATLRAPRLPADDARSMRRHAPRPGPHESHPQSNTTPGTVAPPAYDSRPARQIGRASC